MLLLNDRARQHLQSFLEGSTIHGVPHLARRSKSGKLERLIWMLALIGSSAVVVFFLVGLYSDYNDRPVSVSIDVVAIKEVPFPAVTVDAPVSSYSRQTRFTELAFNAMAFDCMLVVDRLRGSSSSNEMLFGKPCYDDSQALRRAFRPILKGIALRAREIAYEYVRMPYRKDLFSKLVNILISISFY